VTLAEQLRAFHRVVVGEATAGEASGLVRGDDAAARLRVYANAYRSRLGGALDQDYPKLRALLGGEAFVALGRAYLAAHPPSNFSLREAGAKLPRFLFASSARDHLQLDLARLERARVEAFDGPDAETLTKEAVAALPPEQFPGLRLHLVPTAAFVLLTTNADDVWDAIENEAAIPAAREVRRTVLVWRRDLTVVHRTLEEDEASALHRITGGGTFANMCELFAARADATERAIELLLRWLEAGLLRGAFGPK
jgi:hypothetical protein